MFDIGWTEIIVITIIGCLVLDVKDIPKIINWLKEASSYCNNFFQELKQIFIDIDQENKEITKIIDLDGNEQIAYNLDDIAPDILPNLGNKNHEKNKDD